ncbi:MAG: hypothetical protein DRN06_08975, partial [Thermoprotei archaeon]
AENGYAGEDVLVRGDSKLVINQLLGAWALRSPRLAPIHRAIREVAGKFRSVRLEWVPREMNEEADALSRKAYVEWCRRHPEAVRKYAKWFATEKQKALLRKLGVRFHPFISKREASRLISQHLDKLGGFRKLSVRFSA